VDMVGGIRYVEVLEYDEASYDSGVRETEKGGN
jgi:hypothetical protein